MTAAGWPLRWQPVGSPGADGWASTDGGRTYETSGGGDENWIRYRHFAPNDGDWHQLQRFGHVPRPPLSCVLITDFYAYNAGEQRRDAADDAPGGLHWVGDLMLEATLDVRKADGSVALDLVGEDGTSAVISIFRPEKRYSISMGSLVFRPRPKRSFVEWASIERPSPMSTANCCYGSTDAWFRSPRRRPMTISTTPCLPPTIWFRPASPRVTQP